MIDIYQYSDAPSFLKAAWEEKKRKNPMFSLRAWASHLGLANSSPLTLMFQRKRPIPKKHIPAFIESLKLTPRQGFYFENLVSLSNARTAPENQFYRERLIRFKPKRALKGFELESFKRMGDPLHAVLLEMSDLQGFVPDPKWIEERLAFKRPLTEIREALDRLVQLGLFKKTADGGLKKTRRHVTNRPDVADAGSQEYHRRVSELASAAVQTVPVQEREFNGYALNIDPSKLPQAKKLIREFIEDFIDRIEAEPGQGLETVQLNVQLFGLTQGGRAK